MEVLNKIHDNIVWESSESRLTLVCLDETWTEILQWYELEAERSVVQVDIAFPFLFHCSVMNLEDVLESLSQKNNEFQFERVIFLTSVVFQSRIQELKRILSQSGAPECAIITTVTPTAACVHYDPSFNATGSHIYDGYDQICTFLEPAKASLYYFPSHSINLLSKNLHLSKKIELKILASSYFRGLKPLTLSGIGITINSSSEYQSIYDFPAAELPDNVKLDLKWFAHEIAQSLVFDLGVDPTNSIFTLGRTSSLIGHNLLGIIDSISKILPSADFRKYLLSIDPNPVFKQPLKPASLILVDRWEDLFTPVSLNGNYPIAHRILNTLKLAQRKSAQKVEAGIDINLTNPWQRAVQDIFDQSSADTPPTRFETPMSAVAGSGFKTLPSLRYTSNPNDAESDNASILRYKIMACNEEEGRQALVEELKHRIFIENGNLPPAKKRGIGAEISALVQSLLESPGRNDTSDLIKCSKVNFNPFVCAKAERLIALSYAVIDAMQRSSAKQYSSICQWKTSFDDRIQREFEVLANLFQYDDFDVTMAVIVKYFLKAKKTAGGPSPTPTESSHRSSSSTTSTTTKSPSRAGAKSKLKTASKDGADEEKNDPVDVIQTLFMTLGLLSLCRFKKISSNFMTFLLSNLAEYSLEASEEELEYWRTIGILSDSSLKEILEWKTVLPTTDLERVEVIHIITLIIEPSFRKLLEIQHMYSITKQKLLDKRVFTSQTISSNPFDLTNDFHSREKLIFSSNASQTPQGLVSRIVQECMNYKIHHQFNPQSPSSSSSSSTVLMKMLEHIENPLQQLAKKGFGLLSRGLGRLGFGSENDDAAGEHPGNNDIIVLFVIGGISYKEVGQVQAILQEYQLLSSNRIVLMSNNTICGEELLQSVFEVNNLQE